MTNISGQAAAEGGNFAAPAFVGTPMLFRLFSSSLGRLRVVGFLEGLSFLVLLLIAMPLKYLAGQPAAVRHVGMAHGALFVLYVLLVIGAAIEYGWSVRKAALAFVASVVPLGTFWADKRLFREER
jgi:integral membrane protein